MTDTSARRLPGRRLVVYLYLVVVAIAAVVGFILGTIHPKGLDPELFGIVQLPSTPLGVAVYGSVTMALLLGAVLLGVDYVSRHYDDRGTASD